MTNLSDILHAEAIKLEMESNKKKEALRELINVLNSSGLIPEIDNLFEDLVTREKITSTGIGRGIAIPHKLVKGIDKTIMVFGRKARGINYGSIDGKPVTLFFLILGPEGQNGNHLRILSKLSRLLHDDNFRNVLLNAETPRDVIDAVKKQEDE